MSGEHALVEVPLKLKFIHFSFYRSLILDIFLLSENTTKHTMMSHQAQARAYHIDWERLLESSSGKGGKGGKKRRTMSLCDVSSHVTDVSTRDDGIGSRRTYHAKLRMAARTMNPHELPAGIVWMRKKPRGGTATNRFSVFADEEEIEMVGRATLDNGVAIVIHAVDKLQEDGTRKRIIITVTHSPSEFETDLIYFGGSEKSLALMVEAVREHVRKEPIDHFLTTEIDKDAAAGVSPAMMEKTILSGQSRAGRRGLPYILWTKRMRSSVTGREGVVNVLTLSGLDETGTRAKSVYIVQCWFNVGKFTTTRR